MEEDEDEVDEGCVHMFPVNRVRPLPAIEEDELQVKV